MRLFDQVRMKNPDEHAGAFYYALRDTLVAETIEEARTVALHGSHRWRVVTKGGQLIETSGTMSGGGSRVARGLMSNKTGEEYSPAQVCHLFAVFTVRDVLFFGFEFSITILRLARVLQLGTTSFTLNFLLGLWCISTNFLLF